MSRIVERPLTALLAFVLIVLCRHESAHAQGRDVRVQTKWQFSSDAYHPGDIIHAAIEVKLDSGYHVQSNKPADEFAVPTVLTIKPPARMKVRELVYPKAVPFRVEGFDAPLEVFEHEFVIGVALELDKDATPDPYAIIGSLDYQACNDKVCLQPATAPLRAAVTVVGKDVKINATNSSLFEKIRFSDAPAAIPSQATTPVTKPIVTHAVTDPGCDVLARLNDFTILGTEGYLNAEDFIAWVDDVEHGTVRTNMLEGKGPILIMLLVLVGGVLLNLTPCVLPLIPINLAIIGAGVKAGSKARGFALGGTYGLAMAAMYGVLGLVVILTASSFGTINSTVWFNIAIAILFVFLALAMFDVIAIDFTKYQSNINAGKFASNGTFALAFFMGAVSALLAGACVAPVVIQVIVYSSDQYNKGSTIALALPFFLGLGMALPWPFAGAGLSLLPKPGMWMVRVKQAMGVFILAFAAYYTYLAYEIWDGKRVDPDAVQGAVNAQLEGGWTSSICEGLARAKAENKPVVIDMWATWCKNCLVMDKVTFKNQQVIDRLDGYVKIKYQAQDLVVEPTNEILKRFNGIGLPTVAILRPGTAPPEH